MIGAESGDGNAWDTNNNLVDWVLHSGAQNPQGRGIVEAPQSGTPVGGAMVTATDGNSSGGITTSTGGFTLLDVATGTFRVFASNGLLSGTTAFYGGYVMNYPTTTQNLYLLSNVA